MYPQKSGRLKLSRTNSAIKTSFQASKDEDSPISAAIFAAHFVNLAVEGRNGDRLVFQS
jgi:hypothetical protein